MYMLKVRKLGGKVQNKVPSPHSPWACAQVTQFTPLEGISSAPIHVCRNTRRYTDMSVYMKMRFRDFLFNTGSDLVLFFYICWLRKTLEPGQHAQWLSINL